MSTLYLSDLDGTLLDKQSKVSAESAKMLNLAIERGVLFSVATARTPATLSVLLRDVDIRIPMVCMTGVALWDRTVNRYYNVQHFHPDTVTEILKVYKECGLPAFLYTLKDNQITIFHAGPLSAMERKFIDERVNSPYKTFHIPDSGESVISDRIDDAILFFAMQPDETAKRVYDILKNMEGVNPVFYHDPTYGEGLAMSEAFPAGASKAKAALRLAEMTGADRIVAFGDNVNDLPLFEIADVAVAVGNAIQEVKDRADVIIGDHSTDSVAKEILNLEFGINP